MLDPEILSRIQFAFVVSFHILFPAFTIGLASFLAVCEGLYLATQRPVYRQLYFFWVKIFAVSFGMGVVSGIVMSFQFGTNWSVFAQATAPVLGPLFTYEVLTAFFLEATFLGVMLFGWHKVGPRLHFLATVMVALGTLMSAFWILSANSWMQTPAGFELRDGVFYPVDWWAVVFNPSFPYRLVHMVFAAFLTTCFVIMGVGAWYRLKGRAHQAAQVMLTLGVSFAAIVVPLQILAGDQHGLETLEYQPAKLAAIEAHWHTEKDAALHLFAWPDADNQTNRWAVSVPYAASLLLTHDLHGELVGLDAFPRDERPPVAPIFFSFRVMVGLGVLMLIAAWVGAWLLWRRRLTEVRGYHRFLVLMAPSGFIAVLAGWVTTEIGRQPYTVYGLLRTADSVSPVGAPSVLATLITFVLVYGLIFGSGLYYILRLIRTGPDTASEQGTSDAGATPARPLSYPNERS